MDEIEIKKFIKPFIGKTIPKNDRLASQYLFCILEKFQFFKIIKKSYYNFWRIIYDNIIHHIIFEELPPNQIIFRYGEEISGMYIILEGNVNIYNHKKKIDKRLSLIKNNKDIINNIKENSIYRNSVIYNNSYENKKINISNNIDIYNEKNLYFSHQLFKGDTIGDDILKFEKRYIKYTSITSSECVLGFLSKENFEKIFSKAFSVQRNFMAGFILSLNYFDESFFRKKLEDRLYKKFYEKDSYIFIQNSPYKTFYIIFKGTVNISLKLKKTVKCLVDSDFLIGNGAKTERFTTSRNYELKGNYNENKIYNLVNYSQGEIIGGIELIQNIPEYQYTAKCLTEVEVIEFNLKNFHYMDNLKQCKRFNQKIKEQINFFESRIQNINNNLKKVCYLSKQNKYMKTFIENHLIKEGKKSKFLQNLINDSKVKLYKPKNFLKTSFNPMKEDFDKFIKNRKKENLLSKHKINAILHKLYKNKEKKSISTDYNITGLRNYVYKLRKNQTESFSKKQIKKDSFLNENNSITTNIAINSTNNLTDRCFQEGHNSYSTNFYFNSSRNKEKKSLNKIERYSYKNKPKEINYRLGSIKSYKDKKKNIKMNNIKFSGIKKLLVIRDQCNDKNSVSSILRNMFFTSNNKTSKNLFNIKI